MEVSIQSMTKTIEEVFRKSSTMEATPSSSQGVYTNLGYEVQASMSFYDVKSEAVTSQGYTVQTNVQSTLFKE